MSHPLWTLYNSVTEQTIENLDVPGAVGALSTYSMEELAVWFAWHEGLSDWKPILELPEFAGQLQPQSEVTQPAIPAKPALSLVAEPAPTPAAPTPEPVAPEAPVPVEPLAEAAPTPAPVTTEAWEPEVFEEDVSEKTAFGYRPPQDEVTKTVEVTVTNFEVTEVTEVTAIGHAAPTPAAPVAPASAPVAAPLPTPSFEVPAAAWTAPQVDAPVESAPPASAPADVAQTDDGTHLFWMTEGPDGQMQPASLDEMTGSHVHTGAAPVVLSEESEHLAAQAESMPEHGDSVVAKVGTPSRQASFPLASGSAPGGTPASSASNSSGADRRKYPRFDIRYRVIVRNDNLTFRTFSRNISLGGVALEMPVPEALLGSECQIYVGNPRTGENIRFSGKLVANRNDSQFFVFLKSSPDSLTKLQKWVEAHQSHSKRAG